MVTVELYIKGVEEVVCVGNEILVKWCFSVAVFDAMDLLDCCHVGNVNLARAYSHHWACDELVIDCLGLFERTILLMEMVDVLRSCAL